MTTPTPKPFPLWPFYAALGIVGVPLAFFALASAMVGSAVGAIFYTFAVLFFVGIPLVFLIAVDRRRKGL